MNYSSQIKSNKITEIDITTPENPIIAIISFVRSPANISENEDSVVLTSIKMRGTSRGKLRTE